jgi:hypothetical protein
MLSQLQQYINTVGMATRADILAHEVVTVSSTKLHALTDTSLIVGRCFGPD